LSIDEAFSLFEENFGVQKSKQMRKEKAELQKQLREEGMPQGQVVEIAKESGAYHLEDISKGPQV
jgi:SP family myo-inositol transporter-like MFS transporter 13